MSKTRAFLALGSSIEPRRKYLARAASMLEAAAGVRIVGKSRIYESQSVEGGGASDFLNAALEIETELSARELLALCQSIEITCGRPEVLAGTKRPGARTLDLDILSFGGEISGDPELLLPHPRALHRPFVLRPLLDLLEADAANGWVRATDFDWEEENAA